tara:strand:- start:199 stop:309 length:111 start_codon:yes stop_codon:yes gene_type:complete
MKEQKPMPVLCTTINLDTGPVRVVRKRKRKKTRRQR